MAAKERGGTAENKTSGGHFSSLSGDFSRHKPGSYMVVEARLVSSCLSLPSRARPRFSRLAESVGVTE